MEAFNSENTLKDSVEDVFKRTSSFREVTYKYVKIGEDLYLNETIFANYAELGDADNFMKYIQELSGDDQIAFHRVKQGIESKLDVDLGTLREYLSECEDKDRAQVEQQIAALEFTKNGLDFELEAAGYEHGLSDEEIQEKIAKQEELDAKMFGEHVSKNADFILESYVYTEDLLEKKGHELSPQQKAVLDVSQKDMLQQVSELQGIPVDEIKIPKYVEPKKNAKFKELSKIEIPQEDMIEMLDVMFEVSGVSQRSKIGNYAGFYDGDDHFGVPESYKSKTLEEILRIGSHEAYHYISLLVTNDRGNGKQAGDLINDEGNAMYTEALVSGVNTQECSYMTFSGSSVIMNRLYDRERYNAYQDAYLELLEKNNLCAKGDVIQKTLRKKRGFHKSYAGGTNKDAAYALGMKSTLEYMRSDDSSVRNLFSGKVSTEQMKSGEFLPENFGNDFIANILFCELVFFYLKHKDNKEEGFKCGDLHNSFTEYLKEKYNHLSDSFKLFDEAEKFCMYNKRRVVKVLNIIKKASNEKENPSEASQ